MIVKLNFNKMKKLILDIAPLVLVIILSIFALIPLFHSGFFLTHDDTQPARIFEMANSLKMGFFPVRWVKDLGFGFGYPIFNFYAPFVYYLGGTFYLLGFGAIISTKILIFISVLLSSIFMYLFCKEFFGKTAGIIGAIFYTYATYHAVQIYVRGDLEENFAYSLIPLLFWLIYKIYLSFLKKDKWKTWLYVSLSSFAYFLLIITHNLSAVIISIFIFLFMLFLFFNNFSKKFLLIFAPLILGPILSSFYFLPVFLELKYTNVLKQIGGSAYFVNHFVCLNQFWYSSWGYGGSLPGCVDGLSFMIGKLHIIFAFLALIIIIPTYKKNKEIFKFVFLFFTFFLFSIFIQTNYSLWIWNFFKPLQFLQYPWRFLMMTSFFSAFLGSAVFWLLSSYFKKISFLNYFLFSLILISVILLQKKFFVPQKYLNLSDADYISKPILNWKISNISHEYLPKNFKRPINKNQINKNFFEKNTNLISYTRIRKLPSLLYIIDVRNGTNLILNLSYFPFWQIKLDKNSIKKRNYLGLILISVPAGRHKLNIYYEETFIEKLSNLISISGFVFIFIGIIYLKLKYAKKNS